MVVWVCHPHTSQYDIMLRNTTFSRNIRPCCHQNSHVHILFLEMSILVVKRKTCNCVSACPDILYILWHYYFTVSYINIFKKCKFDSHMCLHILENVPDTTVLTKCPIWIFSIQDVGNKKNPVNARWPHVSSDASIHRDVCWSFTFDSCSINIMASSLQTSHVTTFLALVQN